VFIHLVRSTLFVTRRLFLDNTLGPNWVYAPLMRFAHTLFAPNK
jgi:hypothetical protein